MNRKIHKPSIYTFTKLFFLFLIGTNTLLAQTIKGKIVDKDTNNPLEKVNIYLYNNESIGTVSDKNGNFTLALKTKIDKNDKVVFSMLGYKTFIITIASINNTQVVKLSKNIDELDEVVIKGKKLQSKINYNKIAKLKRGIHSFASIIIDNKIYITGGDKTLTHDSFKEAVDKAGAGKFFLTIEALSEEMHSFNYKGYNNKISVFDIEENKFSKTDIIIENRAYHQINMYNNKLFILGGKKVSNFNNKEYLLNTIEILDITTQTIEIDQTNPHKAVNFASFIYKDHLFTLGGSTKINKIGGKVFTDKIHLYNLKTGYWYEFGKLNTPKETSCTLINDKVYLIGGFNKKPLSSIQSWDLTTNKWKHEGELFYGIENPTLTHHNHKIYIYDYGKLLIYNTQNNTLKEYEINLFLRSANMHFYKDALYILGGYKEDEYSKEPSSAIYKIELSEFNKTKMKDFKYL